MAVLRCVSLVAAVACLLLLLPAPTVARRTLGVVNDGDAHSASAAEALAAFSQWSGMRRSLASSPAKAVDMTLCPGDKGAAPYYWPKGEGKLFFTETGSSPCATLPAYIPSNLPKDMNFGEDLHLALYGSIQQPTQLQYTIGQQTTGWDLTTEVPKLVAEGDLAKPLAHHFTEHSSPSAAQCDTTTIGEQCQAMCIGMSTHFSSLCPNGPTASSAAESIVCGFTQMTGINSKCLDACDTLQCAQ